jgi:hypothetical protein
MITRRLTIAALVAIAVFLSPGLAIAQDQITLGGSVQAVTFQGSTGSMTTESVTLGQCNKKTSACNLSGTAFGSGTLGSGPAPYSITSTLNSITMTLVDAAAGIWSFTQTSAVNFLYGTVMSPFLTGSLTLTQMDQAPGSTTAIADATMLVTGGSLAPLIGSNGAVDVTIKFLTKTNLESLLGTNNVIRGKVSSGEILPTPEPNSILLIGSGLLVGGSMLRFRGRQRRSSTT